MRLGSGPTQIHLVTNSEGSLGQGEGFRQSRPLAFVLVISTRTQVSHCPDWHSERDRGLPKGTQQIERRVETEPRSPAWLPGPGTGLRLGHAGVGSSSLDAHSHLPSPWNSAEADDSQIPRQLKMCGCLPPGRLSFPSSAHSRSALTLHHPPPACSLPHPPMGDRRERPSGG